MKINNKFTSLAAGAVLLAGTTTAAVVSTTQPANAAWISARVCVPNLSQCWSEAVNTNNWHAISCANNFRWPVFIKTNPWNSIYQYSFCD